MHKIKIEKSWFYSAGDKYGWTSDGYDKRGVGIKGAFIMMYPELEIEVDGIAYKLDCQEAKDFIKKYSTKMQVKDALLGVVSKSLLKEVNEF